VWLWLIENMTCDQFAHLRSDQGRLSKAQSPAHITHSQSVWFPYTLAMLVCKHKTTICRVGLCHCGRQSS
jgi:hypothetical protein